MPIFRILGGNSSSSPSPNNTSRSFMSSSGNNSSTSSNSQQQRPRSACSQSTYPGLRLQRPSASTGISSSNINNGNIRGSNCSSGYCGPNPYGVGGGGSNRGSSATGGLMSSMMSSTSSHSSGPYVSSPPQPTPLSNPPPVVIRGSTVTSAPPAGVTTYHQRFSAASPNLNPTFNRASAGAASAASTTPSGSSGLTPYVDPSSANSNSSTHNNNSSNNATSRPGAYAVTRSTAGTSSQVYRVTVPPGVIPGNEFTVHAGNRRVRVRCPISSRPGHSLQITLPPEAITSYKRLFSAPLTQACSTGGDENDDNASNYAFPGRSDVGAGGGAVPMTPEVRNVNRAATNSGGTAQTFLVTIPPGIYPGMQFNVNANGQRFQVTCPQEAGPGKKVRIVPPASQSSGQHQYDPATPEEPLAAPKMQVYEVIVPPGVRPNQPFTLMANGQRVLVTCPPNVGPGQKIRFNLPVQTSGVGGMDKEKTPNIQLSYKNEAGSSGWCRTIRVTDMKFQWVRVDREKDGHKRGLYGSDSDDMKKKSYGEDGESMGAVAVEDMEAFDFGKAAYVRKIQYLEGNDARMRTGTVSLVPAQDAVVASKLVDHNYLGTEKTKTLLSYTDIANVQTKSMEEKIDWFHKSVCEELYTPWEKGHVKIVVRRHSLLSDSVDAIMSLGRDDMRKRWRIEFMGEPGIEAGGLTREWFQLVTEQIFDPDFGLWLSSNNNQMSMTINAASHISCPDDHLIYFRFLGRVMGRALFDQQLIKGHMVRHLYKHILGWPITFEDLEAQDEEYYNSLKKFPTMEDLSILCLDFTVTEETLGVRNDVELIPGGNMKEVTAENLPQYLEANLKYRMLNRCKPQTTELLLGFFDIIPEPALTVFDPSELELILCGLPTIDMNDWIDNTKYSGYFEATGHRDQVVEWFWDVVKDDFDQEMKARLLQFVTGTSGVPPRGFSVLQGNDGNIKKFCIHGVSRDQYVYPRAHTCFNRIDLPNYSSKKELRDKLGQAVLMTYVGFDIE